MKTSTQLLMTLLLVLLAATIFIDVLLQKAYSNINLSDPFKNYQAVAVRPFRFLHIKGGNAYAIEIKQAPELGMKVMTTRRSFLTVRQTGDTLIVGFTVPGSTTLRHPERVPLGIIISSPTIRAIIADGSNNLLTNWTADSLALELKGNAAMMIRGAGIGSLTAKGNQSAIFQFHSANKVTHLNIQLRNEAQAVLKGIAYSTLQPRLTGNSQLVVSAAAAGRFYVK